MARATLDAERAAQRGLDRAYPALRHVTRNTATSNITRRTMHSRMPHLFAATAIALLHLAFILFVLLGGLVVVRWPGVAWVHLPAAAWGVLIEFFGWWCPLTKWENHFLRLAGRAGYDGGFVAHYILPIIYPAGLTRGVEIAIGAFVLIINVTFYMKAFR
jgi:hypothetical protein